MSDKATDGGIDVISIDFAEEPVLSTTPSQTPENEVKNAEYNILTTEEDKEPEVEKDEDTERRNKTIIILCIIGIILVIVGLALSLFVPVPPAEPVMQPLDVGMWINNST